MGLTRRLMGVSAIVSRNGMVTDVYIAGVFKSSRPDHSFPDSSSGATSVALMADGIGCRLNELRARKCEDLRESRWRGGCMSAVSRTVDVAGPAGPRRSLIIA